MSTPVLDLIDRHGQLLLSRRVLAAAAEAGIPEWALRDARAARAEDEAVLPEWHRPRLRDRLAGARRGAARPGTEKGRDVAVKGLPNPARSRPIDLFSEPPN